MPLAIRLAADSKVSLYRQIFDGVRQAILQGGLSPGEQLPSSRQLADRLGISRDSVSRAYTELAIQGYLNIVPAKGVVVNPFRTVASSSSEESAATTSASEAPPACFSAFAKSLMGSEGLARAAAYVMPDLNFSAPMLDELPVARWKEMLQKSSRLQDPQLLSYVNDPFGFRPLRQAIAEYLARSRFISCAVDQVAVFTTTEGGTDLICRLLLERGDYVAVENPGSPAVRLTFHMHGAVLKAIPVDAEGLVVDELKRLSEPIKLVYVTPSHHDPTGVVMSRARREQLLEWAQRTNSFIIEDDFDSEYRYGEKPVPAMKGLDDGDCVIYRYNFWRVLFPMARLSLMVLPRRLVSAVWRARALTERDIPLIEQKALAEFIEQGHLERHIQRMKSVYSRRRVALVYALTRHLGKQIAISHVSGGMHVMVRFSEHTEEQVLTSARMSGLPVVSAADHYVGPAQMGQFMIAFAHLEENAFEPMVAHFTKLLRA